MKTLLRVLPLLVCITGLAQDANVIPFQGQLASQSGQPISPTGPSTLVFRLYRQAVGGVAIWEESQPNISVNAGRFSVLLGSRTELPAAPNFNTTLYLGITVDDGNPATADVEMRPRQAIVPVINATHAANADRLRGYDWSVIFGTNNPLDGRISGTKLVDRSITGIQIANETINSNHLANAGVLGSAIASSAIISQHISPGAVTRGTLASDIPNFVRDNMGVNYIDGSSDVFGDGGWQNVLTVTITNSSSRPVIVFLSAVNPSDATPSYLRLLGFAYGSSADSSVRILRNSTVIYQQQLRIRALPETVNPWRIETSWPISAFWTIDTNPGTGPVTYHFQTRGCSGCGHIEIPPSVLIAALQL